MHLQCTLLLQSQLSYLLPHQSLQVDTIDILNYCYKYHFLLFSAQSFMKVPKSLMTKKKKSEENEQTLAEFSSAHRRSQAKC